VPTPEIPFGELEAPSVLAANRRKLQIVLLARILWFDKQSMSFRIPDVLPGVCHWITPKSIPSSPEVIRSLSVREGCSYIGGAEKIDNYPGWM
jgi:hypothetical protein